MDYILGEELSDRRLAAQPQGNPQVAAPLTAPRLQRRGDLQYPEKEASRVGVEAF